MTDLRQAAQQALDALEHYQVKRQDFDRFSDEITALRIALEQQAEPVAHSVIAGALFDFMGWLTTRKERLVLSSTDNASPAADAIKDFAEMRGLSLDDARVQDWQAYTAPPQQKAEPVAWMDREGDLYKMPEIPEWAPPHTMLYTTPPQRQWVGLTDEDWAKVADMPDTFDQGVAWAAARLKEKNSD